MFDIHQSCYDPDSGEVNQELKANYIDGLMREFASSQEADEIVEQFGRLRWTSSMMHYAFDYLGVDVAKMSLRDFNEIVFGLFPEKVSTDPGSAVDIVAELRAFWGFIHCQYGLDNARKIRDSLTEHAAEKLRDELSDPSNFGMAKSFFMQGKKAGFDMTTQQGLEAFRVAYNTALLQKRMAAELPRRVGPKPENTQILQMPIDQGTISMAASTDSTLRPADLSKAFDKGTVTKSTARKLKRKSERAAKKRGLLGS